MTVHALLHLQGHDHARSREAERMEALERKVLAKLGYPDPYAIPD
jgi:probable rRNA maturation factor